MWTPLPFLGYKTCTYFYYFICSKVWLFKCLTILSSFDLEFQVQTSLLIYLICLLYLLHLFCIIFFFYFISQGAPSFFIFFFNPVLVLVISLQMMLSCEKRNFLLLLKLYMFQKIYYAFFFHFDACGYKYTFELA